MNKKLIAFGLLLFSLSLVNIYPQNAFATDEAVPTQDITAPPIINSIAPNSGIQGQDYGIGAPSCSYLYGSNFKSATVKLSKTGQGDIIAKAVSIPYSEKIMCKISLPFYAATGAWDVVVTNSNGETGTLTNGFTVNPAIPAITSITPNSGVPGQIIAITNLKGTNFTPGATVKLSKTSQSDITATGVNVVSVYSLACTIPLPFDITTGAWDVVVTNSNGETGTLTNGFTVNPAIPATPTITSITPNSGLPNKKVITQLVGTNFMYEATVKLSKTGQSDIVATKVNVVSSSNLNCTIPLLFDAAGGNWDVVITNPDGVKAELKDGFEVIVTIPTVTSITPKSGVPGLLVDIANIVGTNFKPGAKVKLSRTGQNDIDAFWPNYLSSEKIKCKIILPMNAAGGNWDVVVTNPCGGTGTLTNGFSVEMTIPKITSITPNSGVPGQIIAITNLKGTNFTPGATVKLSKTGQSDIVATKVNVVSSSNLNCTIPLPLDIATGTWEVVIINPDGGAATLTNGFTVNQAIPTITSIAPNSGIQGQPVIITDLMGTNFKPGATVKLRKTDQSNIIATGVNVASPLKITCTIPLHLNTATGAWNVLVANTDNGNATLANGFNVISQPIIKSLNPVGATPGTTLDITISGQNFQKNAKVNLESGIEVVSYDYTNVPTSFKATIKVANNLTPIKKDLTVNNPDGGVGILEEAFSIKNKPTLPKYLPKYLPK